jgi:hypothetical protein
MNSGLLVLIIFISVGVGLWLVTHILEGLRPAPQSDGSKNHWLLAGYVALRSGDWGIGNGGATGIFRRG